MRKVTPVDAEGDTHLFLVDAEGDTHLFLEPEDAEGDTHLFLEPERWERLEMLATKAWSDLSAFVLPSPRCGERGWG